MSLLILLQDKMASPYLQQARVLSSSDHFAHHTRIVSSSDPKSRSLDASCSSYTTNHPLISAANSVANPLDASCACTNHPFITSAEDSAANSSTQDMIFPDMDLQGPHDHVKMVPFMWEEAPGRPNMNTSSSINELVIYNPSSLQLPPKLQCQSHHSPLRSLPSCQESKNLSPPISHSLSRSPPNKHTLKRLCSYMLKTASCSGHAAPPLHKFTSHSWSNPPCIEFSSSTLHHYKQHDQLAFNDRLFFDRHSPKDLRHCTSLDSTLPIFDEPHQRSEDVFVSSKALSFLVMEEHEEAESSISSSTTTTTASSPWQPVSFHERELGSVSPWQPAPTIRKSAEGKDDDDDDDESFHDLFSTASSSMKPSQRRADDEGMETACSSPSPWYLDFSPEEEEVHVERRGSKLVVTLVALIKLKRVISRKVISKLKRRGEGANHQLAESTIWSPTLATYLYNQQLEEEKQQIKTPISSPIGDDDDDDGHSELGSNSLRIDPNYYLPATIRTHLMNPSHYYSDEESLTPSAAHQERKDKESSSFTEEEEEEEEKERNNLRDSPHRVSLREQLLEFNDEYLNRNPRTLDGHPDNHHFKATLPPSACKGMCKVRQTVKFVASTIKLILVRTEIVHKRGAQRSFKSCVKPNVNN